MPEFFNGSSQSNSQSYTHNQPQKRGNTTKLVGFIAVLLLLVSLPVIILFTRNRQDVRQHASGVTPTPTIPTTTCSNPIPLDSKSSIKSDNVTQITWKHKTNQTKDTVLIVGAETMGGDIVTPTVDDVTGVTYNGNALTKLSNNECGLNKCSNSVWYLANPPVGNFDIVVKLTAKGSIVAGGATFTNVDLTNPFDTPVAANGTPGDGQPTVSLNASNTQLVYDSTSLDDDTSSIAPHAGQTGLWNLITTQNSHPGGSSTIQGTGSKMTLGWTVKSTPNEEWTDIAVAINPTTFDCTTPTPTSPPTPTDTPAPTSCVTPDPIKNVQIICTNCNGGGH